MKRFIIAFFAIHLVLGAGFATAGDFNKGLRAYLGGDYEAALEEWRPLAESGNEKAQLRLGIIFHNGDATPENDSEKGYLRSVESEYTTGRKTALRGDVQGAVEKLDKLARNGHIKAQSIMAAGNFALNKHSEAAFFARAAGTRGDPEAQMIIGFLHIAGLGVVKNQEMGIDWLRKASVQGHASAQSVLGGLLGGNTGNGTTDRLAGYAWTSIAASQGDAQAKKNLNNIAGLMSQADVKKAKALAKTCRDSNYADCP